MTIDKFFGFFDLELIYLGYLEDKPHQEHYIVCFVSDKLKIAYPMYFKTVNGVPIHGVTSMSMVKSDTRFNHSRDFIIGKINDWFKLRSGKYFIAEKWGKVEKFAINFLNVSEDVGRFGFTKVRNKAMKFYKELKNGI